MKIEVGQIWKTEDGLRRIICTDAPGRFPIVSAALSEGCTAYVCTHTIGGMVFDGDEKHCCDLIAEHREPMTLPMWVVVFANKTWSTYCSETEARSASFGEDGTIHRGTWTEETP